MNDLWNINSSSLLLPVKLISFTGKMQQPNIQLQWQAEDVNNGDYFIVERSPGGINFSSVGSVTAMPLVNSYTFTDNINAYAKAVFYRIKVVEHDNRFFYSKVLFFSLPDRMLTLYPNPATSHIFFGLPDGEGSMLPTR